MPSSLQEIKDQLDSQVGQCVTIVSAASRKKVTKRTGVLRQTYPSLFLVELDESSNFDRVSYSYSDILTKNIEIIFAD